jgi:hypothetical protein
MRRAGASGAAVSRVSRAEAFRMRHLEWVLYWTPSATGEGHLANVSSRGVFVRAEDLPKAGESVRIELWAHRPGIVLDGQVRWTSAEAPGAPAGFGVQILEPPRAYVELRRQSRARKR